jgi:phosphoribosylformylglycinamidine synthase
MALAGQLGADVDLRCLQCAVDRTDHALFSESQSRLVVEVDRDDEASFEKAMVGHICARVGTVTADPRLRLTGLDGSTVVDVGLEQLRTAWQALSAQID